MTLTSRQRAQLRSLAHHLKPVHTIGKEGVTDSTISAIGEALGHRELMKVRVLDAAPLTANEAGREIAARMDGVEHVQTIGKTVVLYRRHPETPEIRLVDG